MTKTGGNGGQSTPASTFVIIALCCLSVALLTALLYLQLAPKPAPEQKAEVQNPRSHEMLNAVLWHKTSAEYEAVARQAYATAKEKLAIALEDKTWTALAGGSAAAGTLPPAVILDLDETVLDNLPFEEHLIANETEYSSKSFQAWCENEKAGAIPGAVDFIRYARERGVTVFFISAREEATRACTKADLERIGAQATNDSELILTGGDEKEPHREAIAKTHRILLLIGDNLDDFTYGSRLTAAQRRDIAKQYQQFWGQKWIMLPNPMYGHWEAAIFSFDFGKPRQSKLEYKHKLLDAPSGLSAPTGQ